MPSKDDIPTYEMALTVLFRLLFIAYAEDRDLLPFKGNEAYRRRSLKQKAIELEKAAAEVPPLVQVTIIGLRPLSFGRPYPAAIKNGGCQPMTAPCSQVMRSLKGRRFALINHFAEHLI